MAWAQGGFGQSRGGFGHCDNSAFVNQKTWLLDWGCWWSGRWAGVKFGHCDNSAFVNQVFTKPGY